MMFTYTVTGQMFSVPPWLAEPNLKYVFLNIILSLDIRHTTKSLVKYSTASVLKLNYKISVEQAFNASLIKMCNKWIAKVIFIKESLDISLLQICIKAGLIRIP